MRILYVHATVQPPPTDQRADRFLWLSERLEGEVLQPVWYRTREKIESVFGPGSYPAHRVGRFRYHWNPGPGVRRGFLKLKTFWFYVREGRRLYRERPYDCIVAYSHMTTGLLGCVIKILTGAKLVIEVATTPELIYMLHRGKPTLADRIKQLYSDLSLQLSMRIADRVHLLYSGQLDAYPTLKKTKRSVFHEFVPVSIVERDDNREKAGRYILLLGSPWYLKGADVLVKAFHLIADEFPDVTLKIVGYNPDPDELKDLARGSSRIEALGPVHNPEALKIVRGATLMAQPSRCEGMGRAILEGMAAGVPIVASDVGGIPTLVRDGENGFLCPVGDVEAVAARLRQLLADEDLRRRMGEAGYRRAHTELNEKVYVREFADMVDATVRNLP